MKGKRIDATQAQLSQSAHRSTPHLATSPQVGPARRAHRAPSRPCTPSARCAWCGPAQGVDGEVRGEDGSECGERDEGDAARVMVAAYETQLSEDLAVLEVDAFEEVGFRVGCR